MEEMVTPAAPAFVAPTSFQYKPPEAAGGNERRANLWKGSDESSRGDSDKCAAAPLAA